MEHVEPKTELRRTVCNRDCPDACGIVATVEDGRVTRIQGDPDHPVTRGFLCHRTSHFLETQYAPDRLTTPLLRDGDRFVPIGWDHALDLAASRLVSIRAASGPASIFHYRSGGSLGALKVLCDHFFEQFGPCTIKRGDICSGAGDSAQLTDFGIEDSNDLFDLEHARSIILWGKNVYTSSPHLLPILRRARERGAELMLIDPVHHRTRAICDSYVQPRPGGDFDLAMAVVAILFEKKWVASDARDFCDHVDDLHALSTSRTVDAWCASADVSTAEAVAIATLLGEKKPATILVGWGMGRRTNGSGIVRALDALGALSGNLHVAGGGVSFYFKRRGAFEMGFVKGEAAAPRTVCEPLFGKEILAMDDPPIRAVWITAGNPVTMLPESLTTVRALASREFVVVVDSFMTDTARLAHLVLPTTTLLEADDLLGSYGHHFLGVARPVVPPPPGVRSDLEIMQGLAERVGLSSVMAGSAREWKARLIAPKLAPHGVTLEAIEAAPIKNPLAKEVLFADRRFATATGRVNLITHAPPSTIPPPSPSSAYPLFFMSLATDKSQSSQWARKQEGPAVATLHPDAAAGLSDGALARLESPIASMVVRLKHDPTQRCDVVIVPKGGHLRDGRCANALISAQLTDGGEGGALYDERVRVVPLDTGDTGESGESG